MKRRQPPVAVAEGGVPLELLAGPCIEVWDDLTECPSWYEHDRARWRSTHAWGRWSKARWEWLAANGFARGDDNPLRHAGVHPWSFDFLAEHYPDRLVTHLADRGLPPDWTPTRAQRIADEFQPNDN